MSSKNGSSPHDDERIALVIDNLSKAFRRLAQRDSDKDALGWARAHCLDAVDVLDLIIFGH